jgi:uncharacterized membrane protein
MAAPRWMKWALVASLGLNVAVLGVIGGAIIKGPPPGPMPGVALWHYAHVLPEPYRRELGQALRASRPQWSGPREALRGQRDALVAALTAEPFDPAGVGAVFRRDARTTGELESRGIALLTEQIARMTPEERAAYAEEISRDRWHRRPGRH